MYVWKIVLWGVTTTVLSTMIATVFVGCHIVEVNMVQRAIVDNGNDTEDKYAKIGDAKVTKEEEKIELVVPLK